MVAPAAAAHLLLNQQKAGVKRRWHDNRHRLVTELAESGAGDELTYRYMDVH